MNAWKGGDLYILDAANGGITYAPAHDADDFALARRHGLPEVVAIDEDGRMTLAAGNEYEGMDRFECREALVEVPEAEYPTLGCSGDLFRRPFRLISQSVIARHHL